MPNGWDYKHRMYLFCALLFCLDRIQSDSIFRSMTEEELIKRAMSVLGSRKTPAKASASRRNGKLGGRPVTKKPISVGSVVVAAGEK